MQASKIKLLLQLPISISTIIQLLKIFIIQSTSHLLRLELFAIRYGINQATQLDNINCVVVIIDSLYATKQIFDSLVYLY